MVSTQGEKEYRFLKDQPLQTAEEFKKMKFGHRDIANTLADIVEQCDTPFTVGLFGKWGSGKSTIAHCAKEELISRDVPAVVFDVWKHEGDQLRRCFLKVCYEQLNPKYLNGSYKFNERVEHAVTRTRPGRLQLNKELASQLCKWLLGPFLGALAVAAAILLVMGQIKLFWQAIVPVLTSTALVAFLSKFIADVLTTERTTYSSDRLQDPHEFEKEFGELIRDLKYRKALIIFDNLDRVTHEKAVETLCTIKTFLEPKDIEDKKHAIAFLIPCDDEAIKAHLSAKFQVSNDSNPFEPDEFLKKFFNAIVWIPEFIASELEVFTRQCLRDTGVAAFDDPSVAWLITKAYRDNPRQIIQFVNILLSNYLLIRNREGDGKDFEIGFASRNIKEICLFLLLNRRFPDVMSVLRHKHVGSLKKIPKELEGVEESDLKNFSYFVCEASLEVSIDDLAPYFTLRRSEQEKLLPGLGRLFTLLQDNRIEEAKKMAATMPDIRRHPVEFSLAVSTELERQTNPVSASHFLNSLFPVLGALKVHLTQQAYASALSVIRRNGSAVIHLVSPKELHRTMLTECPRFIASVDELWMSRLREIAQHDPNASKRPVSEAETQFARDVMEVFAENPSVAGPVETKFRSLLASRFFDDLDVVSLFTETEERQSQFLYGAFVRAYVDSLTNEDLKLTYKDIPEGPDKPGKLLLLNEFTPDLFDVALLKATTSKLTELTKAKITKAWNPSLAQDWESFFKLLHDLLTKHDIAVLCNSQELNNFSDASLAAANQIPDPESRRVIMPLLILLDSLPSYQKQSQLHPKVNEFYEKASLKALKDCLVLIKDIKEYVDKSLYASVFERRSMADQAIFDYFYNILPTKSKGKWLIKLLQTDLVRGISKIKEMKYEVPTKAEDSILEQILQSAKPKDTPANHKALCFEVCNEMKCNQNDQLIAAYIDQLKGLLSTKDISAQQVAFSSLKKADFLNERQERNILKETLHWLYNLGDAEKYQLYSLETVHLYVHNLNDQEKSNLTQFCFDDLIRTSPVPEAIKEGFKILRKLKPSYENWSKNFIDLQNRVEQEKNQTSKEALVQGLKSLKPVKTSKGNKDFWNWVGSLS